MQSRRRRRRSNSHAWHPTNADLKEGTDPKYTNIRRIEVRYSDGRIVRFVPEARREFFSKDDSSQLVEVLTKSSSIMEWAEVSERYAD